MAFGSIMSQKPNVYTDDEVLTDETKAIYGLGPEAVPDDVFIILGIGAGKYGYGITVTYPDGTPAANLPVTGVTDRLGQPITTNDKGYFLAVSTEKSITFSIVSPYFDVTNLSNQVVNFEAIVTKKKISFAEKTYTNYILIRNSQTIQFFKDRVVDFTAVGGGGGGTGGGNTTHTYKYPRGAGGGGGYVAHSFNINVKRYEKIKIQIGSGGYAGNSVYENQTPAAGSGSTSIISRENEATILTASGGNGSYYTSAGGNATPGSGNGAGGAVQAVGSAGTGYIFQESSLGLAGGGGGAGFAGVFTDSGLRGGAPFGATGGYAPAGAQYVSALAPSGPGGGGGGGAPSGYGDTYSAASAGASGGVYIRWK